MKRRSILNPWAPESWSIPDAQLRSSLPRVTIGILSYNRRDDLRATLDCITKAVQYPDIEIIVVDNCSSDKSIDMIHSEFPGVKTIALEKNIGTSARNFFYQEASGDYIFSFDDDSFPATPSAIFESVTVLQEMPDKDSMTLLCYQPLTGHTETGESDEIYFSNTGNKGLSFAEGAMCLKASSWKKIDGYDVDFFWGAEGFELTLQMYAQGMQTIYHPGLAVLHMKSNENREVRKNFYFFTRNHIWALAKHFPLYAALPVIFLYLVRKIIAICSHPKFFTPYAKGIKDGILGIPAQRKKCKKLSLRQVLRLKRWYLFLYRW
jgi:hypothetical protein